MFRDRYSYGKKPQSNCQSRLSLFIHNDRGFDRSGETNGKGARPERSHHHFATI